MLTLKLKNKGVQMDIYKKDGEVQLKLTHLDSGGEIVMELGEYELAVIEEYVDDLCFIENR